MESIFVNDDRRPIPLVELLHDDDLQSVNLGNSPHLGIKNFMSSIWLSTLGQEPGRVASSTAFFRSAGVLTKSVAAAAPIPALAMSGVRFPHRA